MGHFNLDATFYFFFYIFPSGRGGNNTPAREYPHANHARGTAAERAFCMCRGYIMAGGFVGIEASGKKRGEAADASCKGCFELKGIGLTMGNRSH